MKKLLKQLLADITLFKIIIIISLFMFLSRLSDISKNGRYLVFDDYNIIDTRTGYTYDTSDHGLDSHLFPNR